MEILLYHMDRTTGIPHPYKWKCTYHIQSRIVPWEISAIKVRVSWTGFFFFVLHHHHHPVTCTLQYFQSKNTHADDQCTEISLPWNCTKVHRLRELWINLGINHGQFFDVPMLTTAVFCVFFFLRDSTWLTKVQVLICSLVFYFEADGGTWGLHLSYYRLFKIYRISYRRACAFELVSSGLGDF